MRCLCCDQLLPLRYSPRRRADPVCSRCQSAIDDTCYPDHAPHPHLAPTPLTRRNPDAD